MRFPTSNKHNKSRFFYKGKSIFAAEKLPEICQKKQTQTKQVLESGNSEILRKSWDFIMPGMINGSSKPLKGN